MTSPRCFSPALVLALIAALASPAFAAGTVKRMKVSGHATAIEGDRLSLNGRTIRLMGIDAPDPGEQCLNRYGSAFDCFAIAKGALTALITGATVDCVIADRTAQGDDAAECFANGANLGAAMVIRGWAVAYRSLSPAYQSDEAYAQSHRLGLWSGQFELPSEWRSRRVRETGK
jgi:endonuclease YncB( thermonuclease family)